MVDRCSKHDEVMGRTFDEINQMKVKLENIDTKMQSIIEFKNMVHDVIFGNGGPGLKGKSELLTSHLGRQWAIICIIITAVITVAVAHYWKG